MKLPAKQLLVAGIVGTVGIAGLTTVGVAGATSDRGSGSESSLVDKLASTFNLDKSKVQKVFDEERSDRDAKHAEKLSERLQKLVDEGTITSAQKTAIEAKLKELKAEQEEFKEELKDSTREERKVKMEEKRQELETWAKAQGIDLDELKGVFFGGPGRDHDRTGPRSE